MRTHPPRFIRTPWIWLAALTPACGTNGGHADAQLSDSRSPASRSHAVIAAADEPGEPLVVQGTVFEPDGTTPAAGVVVYVYHTDATGRYAPPLCRTPRLRAWLVTDSAGRFAYRTIRPMPYPGEKIPAHVHFQAWSARFPPQSGFELEFADDPLVLADERERSARAGRFGWVASPTRDADGTWHATQCLRLKATGDEFEDNIRHGLADCPPELRPPGY